MTAAPPETAPPPAPGPGPTAADRVSPFVVAAVGALVGVGIALRFVARSDLWLDEALTVNIARLPLRDLPAALRHDGAPPLYYLLLHVWIRMFGSGDVAVRSLAGLCSVATLPLMWLAGRQVGGRRAAVAALVLLASSPFAIRYATEARMYSLVTLLVAAGYLCLRSSLDASRPLVLAGLAVASGLAALTHYWALYLLASVAIGLLAAGWRRRDRRPFIALAAIAAGGILFLPWLPSFVYQLAHTGTPWGTPAGPIDAAITTVTDFGGGRPSEARTLAALLAGLVVLALTGKSIDRYRIELDVRTRPGVRPEALAAAATLALGVVAGVVASSAFASRYTAVMLPLVLVVAAWGVGVFGDARTRAVVLLLAAGLGLAGGMRNVVNERTQAGEIAARINARAAPGDVVAYCPDQLGPAVERLLRPGLRPMAFPDGGDPHLVDWVDYAARNRQADPDAFAARVLARAGASDVWLVWIPGYRTFGQKCEAVSIALGRARPAAKLVLLHDRTLFERHNLTHVPAP